jgi:hypothetical protein
MLTVVFQFGLTITALCMEAELYIGASKPFWTQSTNERYLAQVRTLETEEDIYLNHGASYSQEFPVCEVGILLTSKILK